LICPNCQRNQPNGVIECTFCGVIIAKFRKRSGHKAPVEPNMPETSTTMLVVGIGIAIALVVAWFNPGSVKLRPHSLTPGGQPLPAALSPDETQEQTLARHLRVVETDAVERIALVLQPDWIEEDRLGVDQIRVLVAQYTGEETVSANGRFDYAWTRGDERPHTGHTNVQAMSFHRDKVKGFGRDVVYKEVLRIDAPREKWTGQTIRVELTFDRRRSATASLVLEP
jgi:hypothetical protein